MWLRLSASLFLLIGLSTVLSAQIFNPVSWDTDVKPLGDDEFELIVTARLDDSWAIYSQYTEEGGPVPTTFDWADVGSHYEIIGKTNEEGHRKEGIDDLFGVEVIKFLSDEDVVFTQKIRANEYGKPIELVVEFMACDDTQCLPPTEEYFIFDLPVPTAVSPKPAVGEGAGSASQETPQPTTTVETEVTDVEAKLTTQPELVTNDTDSTTPGNLPSFFASEPDVTEIDPVAWTIKATNLGDGEFEIEATAVIKEEWKIYGYALDPDVGPIPTALVIEEEGLTHLTKITQKAIKRKVIFEKVWDADVPVIYDGVTYTQRIKVDPNTEKVAGYITYMVCKEVCLPPEDLPFSLDLGAQFATIGYESDGSLPGPGQEETDPFANGAGGDCALDFDNTPLAQCSVGATEVKGKGLFSIFGLGFLGGLFALIMPCIFPMIPLTVNFFNKGGKDRKGGIKNAGLYGLFIFGIYVLLSLPFHLVEGVSANILNDIASNVPLNIFFFAVFMFFAGSFFGFYELTLPSSWTNSSAKKENSGGVLGIFFMALTLALVSFSCTGPILGSLLVGTASEGAMPLTAGMAGFGLALALPFTLFAAFPQMLQRMPSSGGWLNSVKVVLGFLEVALAFKFLSNADLVGEWQLLKIELFYIIWIICFVGITVYLLGWISFPHDSKNRKTGAMGYIFAISSLVFAGYLATGFQVDKELGSYKPLSIMSGIAPSVCYSFWQPCDCPQGIPCFKDLDEGLAYACKVNKPVMLDFTGYTCTNCRDMEENVWSKGDIRKTLTNDFVLISLYVDDRSELPKEQHQEVDRLDRPGQKTIINKVGKKWHYLEQSVYQKTTQPYYVLISPDGKTLNPPVSYTPDADVYAEFLECGLSTYQSLSSGEISRDSNGQPASTK